MTQLETLIQALCPNGVKFVKLGDCCQILDSQRRPITKSQREAGEYPYYGANGIQDYVADFIFDGVFVLVGEDGSVLTLNGNPVVTWAEGKIWVNNHAHILAGTEIAQLRFLFYVLQTLNISHLVHGNIPKLTKKDLQELQIPLPPLAVQSEIVRILDKFTLYKSELAAELAARCKQYEYYRDKLLTFDENTKRVKLGEVCRFQNGFSFKSTKFLKEGEPILRITNIKDAQIDDSSLVYFNLGDYKENLEAFKVTKDRIVVAMSGATTGKVGINKSENIYYLNQRVGMFVPDESILNNKYLYHFLLSKSMDLYYMAGGGAQPNLSSKAVCEKLYIYIPSLEEQERIAGVLDRLDTLIHDIREGLPAEIDLRQKQYEHYRDKLLTFEAKG